MNQCLCIYPIEWRVNGCAFLSFCLTVGISANSGRPCRAHRA